MNVASKTLGKQKKGYAALAVRGLLLAGLGVYIGIMLLVEGIGDPSQNQTGKAGVVFKLMRTLLGESADLSKIMTYGLAALMVVVALVGLYYFIKGIRHMFAKNTPLGKSILLQLKENESFSNALESIDADMEHEPMVFGKVHIGREWILEVEAMRLSRLRGAFWIDASEDDYVLCCVDDAQNIWASSLTYEDERDSALELLLSRYPKLATGDKEEYTAFLRKELGINEPEEDEDQKEEEQLPLKNDITAATVFTFVKPDGIPTSNFSNQEVLDTFGALALGQRLALCPMDSSIEEISFCKMGDTLWELNMRYLYRDEEGKKAMQLDERAARAALESLLLHKKTPHFAAAVRS